MRISIDTGFATQLARSVRVFGERSVKENLCACPPGGLWMWQACKNQHWCCISTAVCLHQTSFLSVGQEDRWNSVRFWNSITFLLKRKQASISANWSTEGFSGWFLLVLLYCCEVTIVKCWPRCIRAWKDTWKWERLRGAFCALSGRAAGERCAAIQKVIINSSLREQQVFKACHNRVESKSVCNHFWCLNTALLNQKHWA